MTKKELVKGLREVMARSQDPKQRDPERDHGDADELLLRFIGDPVVDDLYTRIYKWYA